jgi:hypothetical protein
MGWGQVNLISILNPKCTSSQLETTPAGPRLVLPNSLSSSPMSWSCQRALDTIQCIFLITFASRLIRYFSRTPDGAATSRLLVQVL